MSLPAAVLFDLDDTLISAYRNPGAAWRGIAAEFADELKPHGVETVAAAIIAHARARFADAAYRRLWRLDPVPTRRGVVIDALQAANVPLSGALAHRIADRYESYRHERMALLPGAVDTLTALRERDVPMALVTNGSARVQRDKIERFGLAEWFGHIQIEGEAGYGKPDTRAYLVALESLGVGTIGSWMVGDDYDYDVVAPKELGLSTIWVADEDDAVVDGVTVVASVVEALPVLLG
ncbi:hypothetical protein WH87_13570 [Devosia epidermidihirudinis]|uniref:Phosphoglycolate phosphatase n=1 Tax=Devosia epidermidihirudinis TaxID=1293439 RepID=A0A0F5Q784_9HYPH|nr:HAD family hydrolase [Devosia epidermidihirudinis]KKC36663.1 hypothetical protein WH87_13570 [Devosia epidermidihirudinis]